MNTIKLWESFEDKLFQEVTQSSYSLFIDGHKGDRVWLCTEVGRLWAQVKPMQQPTGDFYPNPKSLVPAFLGNKPYKSYKLDYPSNTVPISKKEVSKYLDLFPDFKDLMAVVSREDTPDDRYLLFPYYRDNGPHRLVKLITNGPVETHQITIAVCKDNRGRDTGGYKLTFMDDDWVMVEAIHHFTSNGYNFFKCDGFKGVVQAIKHVTRSLD